MLHRTFTRCLSVALATAAIAIATTSPSFGQKAQPERYTALALPPLTYSGSPSPIDIVIERWSTQAEHEKLMNALLELRTKGVVDLLQKYPRVGSFGPPGGIGYPVRYAWKFKGNDGLDHITLVTDRFISFWEVYVQPRSLDYPITVIQLQLKPNGEGEGTAVAAAKMAMDKVTKTIVVENYDVEPFRLTGVRRLK